MKNDGKSSIWLNGMMGLVVADALGVPVEFMSREELRRNPVTDMRGFGTYNLPAGSWSDDSSMALATLHSLQNGYDLKDMMEKFVQWMIYGEYTPFGELFDIGNTCRIAIFKYAMNGDVARCGGYGERDNGNGSLMRILPICLYMYVKQKQEDLSDEDVILAVHEVSALTHGHLRSKIACGLYFFLVWSILENEGNLEIVLQKGLDAGFAYYETDPENAGELAHYARLRHMDEFRHLAEYDIQSTGYVVASLEAALWCLVNTKSYKEATLKAVNLGSDTDTVAAIAGGLAGLYYGYEGIPEAWLGRVQKRDWVEWIIRKENS